MSAPCCSPLRSCSHYNRADPTVPQRVIVSENERGRGLHVGSVSSRTSNTHQRTAPRRYVQKWRSSCSPARRRRRSPSPTFSNVVTSRPTWWSREAPVRGRANVNIPVRIPCVPTSCVRLRRRLDVCACISVVICDDDISSGWARRRGVLRPYGAAGLTNRGTPFYRNASWGAWTISLLGVIVEWICSYRLDTEFNLNNLEGLLRMKRVITRALLEWRALSGTKTCEINNLNSTITELWVELMLPI